MAEAGTLHDAFIDELRDAYDAEKQLTKALPKLARASIPSYVKRLRAISKRLRARSDGWSRSSRAGRKVRGKHCDGIEGIIEEGEFGYGRGLR